MKKQIRVEAFEDTTIHALASRIRFWMRSLQEEFTVTEISPFFAYDSEKKVFSAIVVVELTW